MSNEEHHAVVIAITGGIACGKSEVGACLEQAGFRICDADRVAHELMRRGTDTYRCVVDQFGERIVDQTGEIDRSELGRIVFAEGEKRDLLNRLVHPAVRNVLAEWVSECRQSGDRAAALVPLLFESGMDELEWDAILCVSSSAENMRERLLRRGLNAAEATQRIESQMPVKEKERRADAVIRNDGSLEELKEASLKQVQAVAGLKGTYERRKRNS